MIQTLIDGELLNKIILKIELDEIIILFNYLILNLVTRVQSHAEHLSMAQNPVDFYEQGHEFTRWNYNNSVFSSVFLRCNNRAMIYAR